MLDEWTTAGQSREFNESIAEVEIIFEHARIHVTGESFDDDLILSLAVG